MIFEVQTIDPFVINCLGHVGFLSNELLAPGSTLSSFFKSPIKNSDRVFIRTKLCNMELKSIHLKLFFSTFFLASSEYCVKIMFMKNSAL